MTIGSITVAFKSELSALEKGIEKALELFEQLKESTDEINESLEEVEKRKVEVTTSVDTSSVAEAKKQIESTSASLSVESVAASVRVDSTAVDEVVGEIESSTAEIEVDISESSVESAVDDAAESATKAAAAKPVTFAATIKGVASESLEALKEAAGDIAAPVAIAQKSLSVLGASAKNVTRAFSDATSGSKTLIAALASVGKGGDSLRSLVVASASLTSAWSGITAGSRQATAGVRGFSASLLRLIGVGSDAESLTDVISAAGSAYAGTATSSLAASAATELLNKATKNLDPQLRAAVQLMGGFAIAAARVEIATRTSAASSEFLTKALQASASPLNAAAAFAATLREELAGVVSRSQTASRSLELYASAAAVTGRVSDAAAGAARAFYASLATGAASLKAYVSEVAAAAASSKLLRYVLQEVALYTTAAAVATVDFLSKFAAGRAVVSAFSKTAGLLSSVFKDAAGIFTAFWRATAAGFASLPGGTSAVQSLTAAFASLGKVVTGTSSSLPSLGTALKSLGSLFKVAGVVTGAYSSELKAAAEETEYLTNLSNRFGITFNALELVKDSAAAAGVSMQMLAKAQTTLLQNIGKIKFGQVDSENIREAQISLARLGVSADDLASLNTEQTFELIASKITAVKDSSERAAIAFDLFGKAGSAILPALEGLEQVRQDTERFGAATSQIDLSRLQELDESFDRLSRASGALAGTMLAPLVPIQTGWNNLLADIKGGFNKLFGPIATNLASFSVGWQVLFEVIGRGVNIVLRLAGAVAQVFVSLSNAPALALGWEALGSAIMDVFMLVERLVAVVEAVAGAISAQLTPSAEALKNSVDISKPADSVAGWFQKLLVAAKYLGIVVASLGVAQAATAAFATTSAASSASIISSNLLASVSFTGMAKAALTGFRLVTLGATGMAAKYVAQMITMGTQTLAGFIAPFLVGVATFVTGSTAMSVAATATGYAMAAAWVVGTAGIALILVAISAIYNNFDELYEYFSNFSENAARLFTFDGMVEAAKAAAAAISAEFGKIFGFVGGIFSGIGKAVMNAVVGVKMPESINAAKADAEKIAEVRKKQQEAELERQQKIAGFMSAATFGAVGGDIAPPTAVADETEKVVSAVNSSRDAMNSLIVDVARFGDVGKEAALKANEEFRKLQQQLADNTLSPEKFEEESARIRETLQRNLNNLDLLTDNDVFEFSKAVSQSIDSLQTRFDELARGTDLGSTFSADRFFPTSNAIKQEGLRVSNELAAREKEIAKRLASGEFGAGKDAIKAAQAALADARFEAEIEFKKIDADVAFANDIRKALEDALLDPTDKFEKRLRDIANNKSLTELEKSRAEELTKREFVKSSFGETAGDSLRERQKAFDRASETDAFGRSAFTAAAGGDKAAGEARASAERTKLDIDRRKAAGLDATPAQALKAGVDQINDAFGVAGKSISEIQATLSPQEFAEYQEALKKNRDAVKESLGVEKSGADRIAESRQKLDQALADGVINAEERDKALKKQRDSLLSSLGITKSPAQDFEDAVQAIRDNAKELTPDEIAKGLKEAKDKLLSALGIDKSPADVAAESLSRLNEAFRKGQISQEEFAKGAQKARDTLLQSLGIPLDPVNALRDRMNDLQDAFSKGLITQEQFRKGQEEARRSMLPGAEAKSPVQQFREDLDAVSRAVESGLISEEEGQQRRLNLQADLQENLKPALDSVGQDRRQVGAADVRSREGVDTFFRILQGRDNPSLKAQLETARNTRLLAQAMQDPDAAPVIVQLSAR